MRNKSKLFALATRTALPQLRLAFFAAIGEPWLKTGTATEAALHTLIGGYPDHHCGLIIAEIEALKSDDPRGVCGACGDECGDVDECHAIQSC